MASQHIILTGKNNNPPTHPPEKKKKKRRKNRVSLSFTRTSFLQVLPNVLDISGGTSVSMVQYCFTSTETMRLVRTDSPGRPPRLSAPEPWSTRPIYSFSIKCPDQRTPLAGLQPRPLDLWSCATEQTCTLRVGVWKAKPKQQSAVFSCRLWWCQPAPMKMWRST